MSDAVVAKRYADALFQIGDEKATLDQLIEELGVVKEVFEVNDSLFIFLKHPRINNEKKKQFLEEVFQGIQTDVLNTLKILVERQRVGIIPSMVDDFIQLYNDAKGIAEATVYSVRELSQTEKKELEASFAKRFDKNTIKIKNIVDPELIGGMKIRIGSTIYDGTISGKLKRMERSIVTVN
ncbi:F0F1 ATP synthase subunit delta [Virgibacillus sp. W0181]|uniref:F0F1 ATP synthase subunit delta n=1 Tax=Virgibacillus sp. W0181 TaxID=3391581 RepID=UPI003F4753FC